jgi:hypothetical protein
MACGLAIKIAFFSTKKPGFRDIDIVSIPEER